MNPIKIAGINCNWNKDYAQAYKNKLCENGFYARIVKRAEKYYVAYCYRSFTTIECDKVINDLLGGDV